ncbi:ATP-binding protein [Martelella endophytica]|uniref:histidine kinase n=1 Tax=Martelella endophytica TaxID=1486262 RepID=A0A0D5LP24_MAREN|nr:ATP-binding protein [Martelella endophytica]AJY45517.1 hypothetical protein TM49_07130 [Martelella endophytica]
MRHFGIVTRIALIVTAAMFLMQLAFFVAYLGQSRSLAPPGLLIAEHVVAVVRLLDGTPPERRDSALAVANVSGFAVDVAAVRPRPSEGNHRLDGMYTLIQKALDGYAPDRQIIAIVPGGRESKAYVVDLAIPLTSGDYAVFHIADDATLRVWNKPIGFMAAIFALAISLGAVIAVSLVARPITRLARSVDRLGNRVEPIRLEERGARELRMLIKAINNMQDRILRLISSRTLFIGAISHDLKTYLTRFRLRLEMMPASPHRERAIVDVEQMEQLLNDSLLFAGDASPVQTNQSVDLNALVSGCVEELHLEKTRIEVMTSPGRLDVSLPQQPLRRVIDNLLSNALRYASHARLSTGSAGRFARLTIEDDGPGIPEEELTQVFEPFFRGEPSRNRGLGGTGLGLSIVRQILETYGGSITLENRRDRRGVRVIVLLPFAPMRQTGPAE